MYDELMLAIVKGMIGASPIVILQLWAMGKFMAQNKPDVFKIAMLFAWFLSLMAPIGALAYLAGGLHVLHLAGKI